MKKLFTLLVLAIAVFAFKGTAQTTTCNAEFGWQFLTSNNVKFTPAVNDSPLVHHEWNFGDGTPASLLVAPNHVYTAPGTYNVIHTIVRYSPNGAPVCTASITHSIVIQSVPPTCTLVVDFSWAASTSNPLSIQFTNLSTPLEPSDSTTWSFGDGTSSYAPNPSHTYTAAGTYTVCLIVKKNNNAPGTQPCIRYICKTVVVQAPPPACNYTVDFNWTVSTANPLMYEFHNLTAPAAVGDSVIWNFGDGSTGFGNTPVHIYANPGTYNVCLTVIRYSNSGTQPCVKTTCKTIVIQGPACTLVADFNWTITTSNPLRYEFHNLSTPLAATDSCFWNFGDGSSSTDVNPVHTYANAGTYNVCLIVKKYPWPNSTPCIKYICKTVVVTAPCTLVANFSSHPDSLNSQHIWFTNLSTPLAAADTIRWTFGDGSSSSLVNPDHFYTAPGTYTVCLRIAKPTPAGTQGCVREICKTIVVTPNCNFQPSFTWRVDSSNIRKIIFTNTTIAPSATATATWTFGDGTSASTWNAVHEYAQPGRYYVCLKVQINNTCIRTTCDTILVPTPAPPCNNQSNFAAIRTTANSQTWYFVPDYQNSSAVYTWTFGDGTGSHDMNATHHYANPGTYTVCLTVWRSANCASTTCKTIQVPLQFNCDSVHVGINFQRDPNVPNKLYFIANSNYPVLDQTWTIKRLPNGTPVVLHQNNPSYVFPDTGYYSICLRAVTLGGCVKEVCVTVHIEQLAPPTSCTLQAYPNPASTSVSVNVYLNTAEMINAYIYNSLNVLVAQKQQAGVTGNNVVTMNVATLPAGMYTIKVIHGNSICYAQFQKQ